MISVPFQEVVAGTLEQERGPNPAFFKWQILTPTPVLTLTLTLVLTQQPVFGA